MIIIKNKYIIDGNIVRILIVTRKGENFETLIDLEDLPRVLEFGYSWHVGYDWCTSQYYASATKYCGTTNNKPKYETVLLHKFIMENYDKNYVVDHINHNNLDNRKENLRIILYEDNSKNRKSRNRNNSSGYRNVSYDKYIDKYVVQFQINGKNTRIKTFDNVDEAGEFARIKRKEIYKEYNGQE